MPSYAFQALQTLLWCSFTTGKQHLSREGASLFIARTLILRQLLNESNLAWKLHSILVGWRRVN